MKNESHLRTLKRSYKAFGKIRHNIKFFDRFYSLYNWKEKVEGTSRFFCILTKVGISKISFGT